MNKLSFVTSNSATIVSFKVPYRNILLFVSFNNPTIDFKVEIFKLFINCHQLQSSNVAPIIICLNFSTIYHL